MGQNSQKCAPSDSAWNTFKILQKHTFDLKSGYWIFSENFSCMILSNTRLQLAEEKKRHLLEQVSGNESNRLDLSSKFFQGWWLFGVGTFRSNLRSCFNFFFEFFFCIISMVAWYGCRRENTKWENILNIFRAFQKNGSNYISKNSSYYTRCGRRTFLPVLRHLITLNLPDYCPIISRIKFWWFSFFLNLKTDF